jgi:hypothetical protein
VGEIRPLAGQRADRPRGFTGRAIGEIIGKIEEVSGGVIRRRQMLLEPQQLRCFHLRRDDAADMAQHFVAGRADAISLRNRPVIHPDDDVAVRITRGTDAEWLAAAVEHHQGASRVEADSLDARR